MSARPSFEEFARLAAEHSVVPVWRELLGDLETPVGAFRKLGGAEGSVLLESVEHGERWGRYSFIGTDPFATLTIRGGRASWSGAPPAGLPEGPPLAVLREALRRLRSPSLPGLAPLFAGAVGYLGYDLVRELERLPDQTDDDLGLPDGMLVFPRSVVVFDHLGQRLVLVANVVVEEATDLRAAYADAGRRLDDLAGRLSLALPAAPVPLPAAGAPAAASSDLEPGRYQEMVRTAKRHIRAGDVFQVVPSQRFSVPTAADPFDVYRVLRVVNPSPYMYFLRLPGVAIAGSSPEVLVTVQGRRATMRPIAGTRPRGADQAADLALEAELRADEKERAEHVMLVDLARNDLGRVCRPGTVRVADFMRVERYSHVMHLVSDVEGELADGVAAFDVLAASFPAGTVSGSPKVRAMEIIDDLERHRRGPYAGCVGYFDFSGNLDTCITIRTCVMVDGVAHCQAGAGVVADSVPELEERETEAKARAVLAAVAAAEALSAPRPPRPRPPRPRPPPRRLPPPGRVAEPPGRPPGADPGRRSPGPGGAGPPTGAGPGGLGPGGVAAGRPAAPGGGGPGGVAAGRPAEPGGGAGPEAAGARRSLRRFLVVVVGGVVLAAVGAGRPWAVASAAVSLPGLGAARLGAAELTGNDLAPLGGLALLGLVLLVGVAVTRGRGRWAVGLALLALGAALAVQAVAGAAGVRAEAEARARRGQLEGVPAGAGLRVATRPAGPAMAVAGGLLLAAAGVEALRRGRRWPALGDAFRAPPDRAQPRPAGDGEEPPWEGA